ncbi:elongator complex protein 6 [Acrasis kona]|uniref:Elongator complex protein 6 n=1 Tax=Acrasis kona TaxID=1008807 RepID=A0AAW2ZNT1_9EUKA
MTTFKELNNACQWEDDYAPLGQLILIRDRAPSDGSLFIHHLLNSYLAKQYKKGVGLVSLNHTFLHYQTIELKLNSNLLKEGENNNFHFVDAVQGLTQSFLGEEEVMQDNTLLYASPVNVTDVKKPQCISVWKPDSDLCESLFQHIRKNADKDCLIIDHLNPLLYAGDGGVYKLMRKLHELTKKENVTVVVAIHDCAADYRSEETRTANFIEHLSDITFRVSGLPSGYSKDVHGQVEVVYKKDKNTFDPPKHVKLHFKTMDHSAKLFAIGNV